MIKFYYPKNHYDSSQRWHLFPLLKPFIKSENFTDKERIDIYNVSENDFSFTDSIEDCDIAILTMSWNYYKKKSLVDVALNFIGKAKNQKKHVWIMMVDDFGIKIDDIDNCTVFRMSGYNSKLSNMHKAIPAFVDDPLKVMYNGAKLFKRTYNDIPTVGFCGLASESFFTSSKEWLKILYRNITSTFNISYFEKELLVSPSGLRTTLLNLLENSNQVDTNFIVRKRYRAGVKDKSNSNVTRIEFFENIKNSDYILCVKGAGNFSVRFYETLAMGRIPVFINTDCKLPLDNIIKWKDHMVWVDYEDRFTIAEKIIDFHRKLNETTMNELFVKNRELWQENLRLSSYFLKMSNE